MWLAPHKPNSSTQKSHPLFARRLKVHRKFTANWSTQTIEELPETWASKIVHTNKGKRPARLRGPTKSNSKFAPNRGVQLVG